jgi:hypothetical protein
MKLLRPTRQTCTNTAMVRVRGRARRGERLVDYAPHGAWKGIVPANVEKRETALLALSR